MKRSTVILSLTEQLFTSGFTFFLLIAATRMLTNEELGLYSALLSLNQNFSFFLFGLVLLPVSSASGDAYAKQLGISIALLLCLIIFYAIVSPLAMHFFVSFEEHYGFKLWILSVVFFATHSSYESSRWLIIRIKGNKPALCITLLRFTLFFTSIFTLDSEILDSFSFTMTQIVANITGLFCNIAILRNNAEQLHLSLPDRSALKHMATFGNATATFLTNFTIATLVDRGLGAGGLAVFQTIRSATNPIGMISQVLDNHFSSELARSGKRLINTAKTMRYALISSALLMIVATLLAKMIISLLFAGQFLEHWALVPLMLLASLTHALTRPLFIDWRISGNTRALNIYSILLIIGVLPLMIITALTGFNYAMIIIFVLQPLAATLLELQRKHTFLR